MIAKNDSNRKMKYSFYESHDDDSPPNDIGKDQKADIINEQAPWSNNNVHQFYQVTEESGDSKGKTDALEIGLELSPSKNEHQHGKTPTPRSVIHFPSENAHDVKENTNKQDHTSGKKVHQFYEPSEVPEDTFSPLDTFPRKAVQDDVIAAREQEPLSNENVHQFYQPSDEPESTSTFSLLDSLPVDTTEDVNANEQEPSSNSNVHQFYQTSGEPSGTKEKTNAPESKKVHQFYEAAESPEGTISLLGGFPTKAAQDDVITTREKESSSNDKMHQFYQPCEDAGCDFSLFDSFSGKNTQGVNVNASANKQESPPNKNVHQFYQSVETVSLDETATAAAHFDRRPVENTQDAKVSANKQESPSNKNVHQFYQSAETREDNMPLDVTAAAPRFDSHPVERINTEDASSLNDDMHQCLDNVFNNMDEICHQQADAHVSDISLDGAPLFTTGSTKYNFNEQSGDNCCPAEEIIAHDAKKDSKGPESSPPIKSFHQFYQPSEEPKNPITLSVKDIATRSARKAHLTSLNLKTVESLALLQSYHESKRSEVRLLDKYGLGSAASN